MNTMQCQVCGYCMDELDTLSNVVDSMIYPGIGGISGASVASVSSKNKNYVQCPNCGTAGKWTKNG